MGSWVARPEALRRACGLCKGCAPFAKPQDVPPRRRTTELDRASCQLARMRPPIPAPPRRLDPLAAIVLQPCTRHGCLSMIKRKSQILCLWFLFWDLVATALAWVEAY